MTYPYAIDSDVEIPRIDDNLTQIGGEAINALRDAVFALEEELGINPAGSLSSVADRLNVSLNGDGTIKSSALTSIGLVTLPIDDADIGNGAGIKESKLTLDYSTSNLFALISNNSTLITALVTFTNNTSSDLLSHIGGATTLLNGASARHVGAHIDLGTLPSDPRFPSFVWAGLHDKFGVLRSATQVTAALDEINTDLINHENAVADAHVATAITVDTDDFLEIPTAANTVQKALEALDAFETNSIGEHRAVQHANCVPPIARSYDPSMPDGYFGENVVPSTACSTYLAHPLNTLPSDDNITGDDVIAFSPVNTGFVFDSQFSKVKPGDIITVNYGNGVLASFPVESTQFTGNTSWRVRINGYNLYDSDTASARIDRPRVDTNTAGVLAVAAANASPINTFNILTGVIVGNPRGATALGLGFDANQLDDTHYKLYLEFYPTGVPSDRIISLPFIDVTGNAGTTPGAYTLSSVIQSTNNALRQIGYNYRFIAFAHNGEFGIMLADCISNASFAIISGENVFGTLTTGVYTENVIGGSTVDTFDALGFGSTHANIAGSTYQSSYFDTTTALLPAIVITPRKSRNYIVNGRRWDQFAETYNATSGGYWDGYISSRVNTGTTIETTYTIFLDLKAAELKSGKTIVVQPAIDFTDPLYNDVDYGRFIIKDVNYVPACTPVPEQCLITVISGVHATGNPLSLSGVPSLPVRLYFSEDSVSFNNSNMISGGAAVTPQKRFHEIFISDKGKTFSHERARFAFNTEDNPSGGELGTYNWHVRSVSPNLRGYRDTALDVAKYVRFYILSYDTVTGEYDGYIGKRNPSNANIDNVGPITRGRKNVVTRFYDETYLDYIDMIYIETSTVATSILSTANARWMDIEVFSSLQTDEEFLPLATCEVNWGLVLNHDVVEEVIDVRQFGSISEKDFTESAKEYISAGDRYLHENGIIRGLGFDYINVADNREIFFKGGIALVNGTIVTVNNISVTIPQVSVATSPGAPPWPTSVTWAVCINESGMLVPIVISPVKDQYFANTALAGMKYYVPSVTFAELITSRKDLTPIVLVTAAIASVTITDNDIKDVRRFIAQEGSIHPLTLSGPDSREIGNFNTFEALISWINNYGTGLTNIGDIKVKIKGQIDITTAVDLTNLFRYTLDGGLSYTYKNGTIIFEGDNAVVNITAANGFLVGMTTPITNTQAKVTFRNINFIYNPDPSLISYSSIGLVRDKISVGHACIYKDPSLYLQDLVVENCHFSSTLTERPPFISLELDNAKYVDGVTVRDCTFADITATTYAAIAMYSTCAVGVATSPATVTNVLIENNICSHYQGIYITALKTGVIFTSPGIYANNVRIVGNKCGAIGYMVTSIVTAQTVRGLSTNAGLTIVDNTCRIIASMDSWGDVAAAGSSVAGNYTYGSGNVSVTRNYCSWIQVTANDFTAQSPASVNICDNILKADDPVGVLQNIYWKGSASYTNYAIYVYSIVTGQDLGSCIIDGNIIEGDTVNAYTYTYGIKCAVSAVISKNIIRGFTTYGLSVNSSVAAPIRSWTITENKFYRDASVITAYIVGVAVYGMAHITNNYFDSESCDGATDYDVVKGAQDGWVVEKNKNQRVTVYLSAINGSAMNVAAHYVGKTSATTPNSYIYIYGQAGPTDAGVYLNYADTPAAVSFNWYLGLIGILPKDVYIVDASIKVDTNINPTAASASFKIYDADFAMGTGDTSAAVDSTGVTLTLSNDASWSTRSFYNHATKYPSLSIITSINDAANPVVGHWYGISLTYRW